jgi:HTH-type transcriptional regulator / antitoxin HigA
MDIKPINNREEYEDALVYLSSLIDLNPEVNTPEDGKIRILSRLIEDFESSMLPEYIVDPIEAIKFRMNQMGLRDKDLIPFLGTRSRVSEVLSKKRPLTVSMIRSLEEGLGIPATILINSDKERKTKRWNNGTLSMMASRGYFGDENKVLTPKQIRELGLLNTFFSPQSVVTSMLLRQTNYRDINSIDKNLLSAWTGKVLIEALARINKNEIPVFEKHHFTKSFLLKLFKLSANDSGVNEVLTALRQKGVVVVIEPHLPSTRLDGATLFTNDRVIIGLTLRYDRLDNFWFTLAHELSHVFLHSDSNFSAFYDQFSNSDDELVEVEEAADELAGEILIPSDAWRKSPLRYGSTPTLIKMFAESIGVHEAVVVGRIRHDSKDWTVHSDLIHEKKIRHMFKDKIW